MEITKRDLKYFKLAESISKASTYKQHHLGCVVVKGKHVISIGWNDTKTSPLQAKYNKFRGLVGNDVKHQLHAETMALGKIKDLDIDFTSTELYIFRQHKDGSKALARPCKACFELIRTLGIRNVNYTVEGGYACEKVC